MAALKIIRPPLCGDQARSVPRQQWPTLVEERQRFCKDVLPSDCRMLLFFVEDGEDSGWMGYGSRETYLCDGLQLDPEMVEIALRGLKLTDPEKAVGMNEAVVLGKKGRPKKGEEKTGSASFSQLGTTRATTLARLKRDRPDLLERVGAGELSANAAAIEAGFRKPPKPRLTHCPHCGCEL